MEPRHWNKEVGVHSAGKELGYVVSPVAFKSSITSLQCLQTACPWLLCLCSGVGSGGLGQAEASCADLQLDPDQREAGNVSARVRSCVPTQKPKAL